LLGIFGVLAFLPGWQRVRAHHFLIGGCLLVTIVSFYLLLFRSTRYANDKLAPRLQQIEQKGPD
jgi:hypothetical protein